MFDEHTHKQSVLPRSSRTGRLERRFDMVFPGEFMSSVLRWTAAKVRFRASDSGDYCRLDSLRVPVGLRDSGGMTHLTGGGSTDSSRSGSGFM
ncbi:hypothetical protein OROGR_028200 [Orobanche gracilis]